MFSKLERRLGENNRDFSYRVIRQAIMSLQLKPGQSISEIELADALQISRTPIREVMAKLKEEHLVEVIPQVGTYVSKIQPTLIEEAIFVRITLEKEILKLSCMSFPDDKLLELKKNLVLQELLLGQTGIEQEFHKLDKQFHLIIFQGNHKENAWEAINRLATHYNRMRLLFEMECGFDKPIKEHKEILTIIENKQIDRVEDIIKQHITEPIKQWERLLKSDSPYVDYFDSSHKIPIF